MKNRLSALGSRLAGDGGPTADSREPTAHPNWPLLYSVVLIELAILIIVFYAFTKAFA